MMVLLLDCFAYLTGVLIAIKMLSHNAVMILSI